MKRFLIACGGLSPSDEKDVHAYLGKNGSWWHWVCVDMACGVMCAFGARDIQKWFLIGHGFAFGCWCAMCLARLECSELVVKENLGSHRGMRHGCMA